MGQAKARGTKEERCAAAIERAAIEKERAERERQERLLQEKLEADRREQARRDSKPDSGEMHRIYSPTGRSAHNRSVLLMSALALVAGTR